MYRRFALQFNKKKVEFINCVNMVERMKKARALNNEGMSPMGVKSYSFTSGKIGNKNCVKMKDCM